jgi:hypothetical protein
MFLVLDHWNNSPQVIILLHSHTETLAVEQTDGSYRLYGYKWFSSATDSDIAFTLARVVDRHNNFIDVCCEFIAESVGRNLLKFWYLLQWIYSNTLPKKSEN